MTRAASYDVDGWETALVEFVSLTVDDLDVAAPFSAAVFAEPPWSEPWTAESARARLADLAGSPGYLDLLGLDQRGVVALADGHHIRGPVHLSFELYDFCVRVDAQRTGAGRRLLTELKPRLAVRGVTHVMLITGAGAEAVYRAAGYTKSKLTMMHHPPPAAATAQTDPIDPAGVV